ncbi:AER182Wp [Eremothecium gossypii ATCC 10895]|uniref:AER182Wp n=1 Tax=Eremothecium gossypii (strain ATCC 10895 / CBS 109.51 / FGSC 9923 / NRRL Y-1056) TaxID=284811 RepID=Q756S2_EREGS|nr:AER182Wp [Eremothecium gossypii ATCC 10895]AAS52863.1 AER182Wp [Eremothecium gossypii ATCC 10895]AEY97170.1 FAER182Wp [Eremothecium gossypii FDAG1]
MFFCLPVWFGKRSWDRAYGDEGHYSGLYCPRCQSFAVSPVKRREFVTLLWVPFVPLYWGNQLRCAACGWRQDFKSQAQLEKVRAEQDNIRGGRYGAAPPAYY